MTAHICVTCGVQQADRTDLPERCAICEDERQYVGLEIPVDARLSER
jgi:hypothetical protein